MTTVGELVEFSEDEAFARPTCVALTDEFEELIERYYRPLYQFALSLTRSEADACDLTQHTFYTWRIKGSQLRDVSKVRSWLFTTLHRAFLQTRRRESRFPHFELQQVNNELPAISAHEGQELDSADVLHALTKVDELFRAPLALCYLEDCPYKEIAAMLDIPLGTVKSRISRGILQLKALLTTPACAGQELAA
jgi:RNA polymerase sigma-70 factor (ECF subfamily)